VNRIDLGNPTNPNNPTSPKNPKKLQPQKTLQTQLTQRTNNLFFFHSVLNTIPLLSAYQLNSLPAIFAYRFYTIGYDVQAFNEKPLQLLNYYFCFISTVLMLLKKGSRIQGAKDSSEKNRPGNPTNPKPQ